jgi:hypothetical protein
MHLEILDVLHSAQGQRDLPRMVAELRKFTEAQLFETLFPLCIREQSIGSRVAFAAYAIHQLNPKCELAAINGYEMLLDSWDISIEEVVFYLAKQFGRAATMSALDELRSRGLTGTAATRLRSIGYWLGIAEHSPP